MNLSVFLKLIRTIKLRFVQYILCVTRNFFQCRSERNDRRAGFGSSTVVQIEDYLCADCVDCAELLIYIKN